MTQLCDSIFASTSSLREYKETEHGVRIRTTCVFPSFEPVFVYVVKLGSGFVVHDAGETMAVILTHGQGGNAASRSIRIECKRYDLAFEKGMISFKVDNDKWLESAIVAVSSSAASAARVAIRDSKANSERELVDVIFSMLEPKFDKGSILKKYSYSGKSGRHYQFDLAVKRKEQLTLIETVTAHANSINSKYVAMADVSSDFGVTKIVAHNDDLSNEDIILLQDVAIVARQDGVMKIVNENGLIG